MNKSLQITLTLAAIGCLGAIAAPLKETEAMKKAIQTENAFSDVIEYAKPAVVVITNKQTPRNAFRDTNEIPEEFFRFFNIPQENRPNREQRRNQPQDAGTGSGFFISKEGHILTNYHVIKDSDYLEVKSSDGKIYDNLKNKNSVTVIGYDEESDLAVIKIQSDKECDYLEFANSDQLRVGQWAIAIGAPFSLDNSVTIGCISQKGRTDMGMSTFDSYIQTDASINPGNSGGPLLNIRGQVIGVNQFIVTGGGMSRGSVGIGFAIASNLAKQISDTLMSKGEVIRPFLGITMQDLNEAMKEQFNLEYGILVREALPGEAAEKAGICAGDIIIKVGDKKIANSHELLMTVTQYQPGDKIKLTIIRDDKTLTVTVKTGRRDDYLAKDGKTKRSGVIDGDIEKLGLGLIEQDGKVIVKSIQEDGAAEQAGTINDDKILEGDILIEINRIPIHSLDDVRNALKNIKKNTVIIYLERQNKRNPKNNYKYFMAVNLGKKGK